MWTDLRTLVTLSVQSLSDKVMARKKSLIRKTVSRVAVGTTIGAVLAAGAAAYFFTQTKSGKQAATQIKTAAIGLSREISKRVQSAKKMQVKYNDIVEEWSRICCPEKVGKHTVVALKRDLKTHWRDVKRELKSRVMNCPYTVHGTVQSHRGRGHNSEFRR